MKPEDFYAVLATVSAWPADRRASLAHALIDSLTNGETPQNRRKPTIEEIAGIARGEGPPPTDEQVKQWIDEDRMQKYGR